MRLAPLLSVVLTALALAATSAVPMAAGADVQERHVPDAPVTSSLDADEESRVAIAPASFPPQVVQPGTRVVLALEVRNHTDRPIAFSAVALPLQGSSDPEAFAAPAGADAVSATAVDWVDFGFDRWPSLAAHTQLRFPVAIQIPPTASPGSYALGLAASQQVGGAGGIGGLDSSDARVRLAADVASSLVLTVDGEADARISISDVASPRVVWGGAQPRFTATVRNRGNVILDIDGEVQLDAFLGSARRDLGMREVPTLPGGRRDLEFRWQDPPLVGWFRPELVVVGGKGSGVRVERQLPTVFVLPPWWLLVILAAALWLPLRAWRHRRHDPARHEAKRAHARHRVEQRLKRDEARQRADAARRRR